MIPLSPRAARQVLDLAAHYERLGRYEAVANLDAALEAASAFIVGEPSAGLTAPRPYPQLSRAGMLWVKAGRYWIAYRQRPRLAIAAVFYEAANISGRF